MANNKNNKQRTKSSYKSGSDKRKWVITIGAFVLILALVISVAYGTEGFRQGNPKKWFDGWGKHVESSAPADNGGAATVSDFIAVDNNGNTMQSGRVYTMPKGFTFVNALSEENTKRSTRASVSEKQFVGTNSVTVRATITPENADDQRVTWESSDPLTVSVTPTSEGSLTATIKRERNLYEDIIITCRSIEKPEIYSTCKIGQLISGDILELTAYPLDNGSLVFGKTYEPNLQVGSTTPGVGTVLGEIGGNIDYMIELTDGFISEINKQLNSLGVTNTSSADNRRLHTNYPVALCATPYEEFCNSNLIDIDVYNRAFKLAVKSYTDTQAQIVFNADYVFQGMNLGRISTQKQDYQFDVSNIWIPVSGLDIGNDVVFQ